MQELLDRMSQRVRRHTQGLALETALPRVSMAVSREETPPTLSIYEPMVCMVLQGAKQVHIGDQVLRYDAASCFVASIQLPATGCIIEATPDEPYVVASLRLDREALAGLLADLPPAPAAPVSGFGVAPVTRELLEAWDRLLALLDAPEDIAYLGPAREREVLYRLLRSGHGPMLRALSQEGSRLGQIHRAIDWIRRHYDQTLRTEALAAIAGMSIASFHRHFKAVTAMSPLQFQKALRLQTARRLLTTQPDAARAAHAVGYESASQFSRDYARQFGAPPVRDMARMREVIATV